MSAAQSAGASIKLSCPAGHVEIEVSGAHASMDDLAHLEETAMPAEYDRVKNRECPACWRTLRLSTEA